jgi:hypothetical protein
LPSRYLPLKIAQSENVLKSFRDNRRGNFRKFSFTSRLGMLPKLQAAERG